MLATYEAPRATVHTGQAEACTQGTTDAPKGISRPISIIFDAHSDTQTMASGQRLVTDMQRCWERERLREAQSILELFEVALMQRQRASVDART